VSLRTSAELIVLRLREAGHQAYLVGGCVRDMLLGAGPHDYDIATSALPHEVRPLFEKTIEVGAAFGVTCVRVDDEWFEVAAFRTDLGYSDGRRPDAVAFTDAKGDVERRDFTINGLLYDPVTEEVIDYVGGRADLEARVVRCIGEPLRRFEEDKLRLLRAVRFAARLEYEIEADTFAAMTELAPQVTAVSAERIGAELLNIFTAAHADRALALLAETGLLAAILPEIDAMRGVEQPPKFHPEGDVFEHTRLMLGMLDSPGPALALAALLHDVGKPPTFEVADRIRFNRHDRAGAAIAETICRRLRMPNDVTATVVALVASHMTFVDIQNMRESRLKRLMREGWFADALELHRLDCLASHGKLGTYEWCRERFDALEPEQARPQRLVTGHDLIEMGQTPGPQFRSLLDAVEDAQLEGRVATREDAIEFVRRQLNSRDLPRMDTDGQGS
jgi:poly(A) polymerase